MSENSKTNKPFHRLAASEKAAKKRLIVILEKASLETVKVRFIIESYIKFNIISLNYF